jgi:hypothetical protein
MSPRLEQLQQLGIIEFSSRIPTGWSPNVVISQFEVFGDAIGIALSVDSVRHDDPHAARRSVFIVNRNPKAAESTTLPFWTVRHRHPSTRLLITRLARS